MSKSPVAPPLAPPVAPTGGDALLWRRVAETVKPLKRRKAAPVFPPAAAVPPPTRETPHRARRPMPRPVGPPPRPEGPPPELRAGPAAGVDRSTNDKLRRGQLPIDAKLDLHGMDRERAHRALDRFLESSSAQGRRCVLVVTGKSGVLKADVPRWLTEQPARSRLIAFAAAQPRHGGAGALYVLLKRQRASE
ncbi:MAG: Smr/MutS family protein [Alphaproteobacteria bacterium]|nr:Smr/MutS family protein [Alphaproteobacteria bacterium]